MNHKITNYQRCDGKTFKNYKDMCNFLGDGPYGGNQKKAHLKKIESHLKLRKEGHKYIVEKVFDAPIDIPDARKNGNHTKYARIIRDIIVLSQWDAKESVREYTPTELLRMLGLYSLEEYIFNFRLIDQCYYATEKWLNNEVIKVYFYRMHYLIHRIYSQSIQKESDYMKVSKIMLFSSSNISYDIQCKQLEQTIEQVLKEKGYKNMNEVYRKIHQLIFYNRVKHLMINNYGYYRIGVKYHVDFICSKIQLDYSQYSSAIEREKQINKLQHKLQKCVVDSYIRSLSNYLKKIRSHESPYSKNNILINHLYCLKETTLHAEPYTSFNLTNYTMMRIKQYYSAKDFFNLKSPTISNFSTKKRAVTS